MRVSPENLSELLVIAALAGSKRSWTDLYLRTDLSRAGISLALQNLSRQGAVMKIKTITRPITVQYAISPKGEKSYYSLLKDLKSITEIEVLADELLENFYEEYQMRKEAKKGTQDLVAKFLLGRLEICQALLLSALGASSSLPRQRRRLVITYAMTLVKYFMFEEWIAKSTFDDSQQHLDRTRREIIMDIKNTIGSLKGG